MSEAPPRKARPGELPPAEVPKKQPSTQEQQWREPQRLQRSQVTITGTADHAHEVTQATRFGQQEGGGTFDFLGNSSQGIEGYFTPKGTTQRLPVSLKDLSGTGRLPNIISTINRNAKQVTAAGEAGAAILHVRLGQFKAQQVAEFIRNGPLIRMPNAGVFKTLIFDCADRALAQGVRFLR